MSQWLFSSFSSRFDKHRIARHRILDEHGLFPNAEILRTWSPAHIVAVVGRGSCGFGPLIRL